MTSRAGISRNYLEVLMGISTESTEVLIGLSIINVGFDGIIHYKWRSTIKGGFSVANVT
jgi:hypothetical protein